MDINYLWSILEPNKDRKELIRQDLENGLAPNLPYFIIGQNDAKLKIGENIKNIDQGFRYSYIRASYGNGKSNLMKYLQYFFECNKEYGIQVEYWRADPDVYDIIKNMLNVLQVKYVGTIRDAVRKLFNDDTENLEKCANSFSGSFAAIQEYVLKYEEYKDDDENLNTLIALGTGRLYTAGSFSKVGLSKLSDFNRREILVFFLNVLAYANCYIIFCYDEIEHIQERSKARLNTYLTSFRELIDLSSLIKGHYVMVASTTATGGASVQSVETVNPAFARRISNQLISMDCLTSLEDVKALAHAVKKVIESEVDDDATDKIASLACEKHLTPTSSIVEFICRKMTNTQGLTLDELLDKYSLYELFETTTKDIEDNGGFVFIQSKLFTLLEQYYKNKDYTGEKYDIKTQKYSTIYNKIEGKSIIILTSDNRNQCEAVVRNAVLQAPTNRNYVFCKSIGDLSVVDFTAFGITVEKIFTYDPRVLMTLLEMFKTSIRKDVKEHVMDIINSYTHELI